MNLRTLVLTQEILPVEQDITRVIIYLADTCFAFVDQLVAGLLGVESGQDAVIRALLYEKANETVKPYGVTVAEFTNKMSQLRNVLGRTGIKDEGLVVPELQGAEGKIAGNVLAGDENSVAFDRNPEEILSIVYGSGDEHVPGGFYPKGADGRIARSHLHTA